VLTLSTVKTLRLAIKDLEMDLEVDALVLTASPGSSVFCAGLDLREFHKPDSGQLYQYWQEVKLRLLRVCSVRTV
jgi:enoyl-CoA hydratase/carnithine racemase